MELLKKVLLGCGFSIGLVVFTALALISSTASNSIHRR